MEVSLTPFSSRSVCLSESFDPGEHRCTRRTRSTLITSTSTRFEPQSLLVDTDSFLHQSLILGWRLIIPGHNNTTQHNTPNRVDSRPHLVTEEVINLKVVLTSKSRKNNSTEPTIEEEWRATLCDRNTTNMGRNA